MPRPQVDPQNRKRALQACVPCRTSKKRCDSKIPCSNCLKRSDGGDCVYSNPEKPRIPGNSSPTAGKRDQSDVAANGAGADVRILWTSRGSQVYIGGSASLSFLNLLRNMLTRYMGPSEFTNDTRRGFMLETQRNLPLSPEDSTGHYDRVEDMIELVDTFLAATCGVLDVLERKEIMQYLQLDGYVNSETTRAAVVDAMIAVGAQCRARGSRDQQCERVHLEKAQRIAFENMLEDPNIDMVRLFLVLSFYMLGACRRNAAFMYIGVAARAAHVLGLHHQESYRSIPPEEKNSWLTTWRSVRILDLLVSSILGRPPATSQVETTPGNSRAGEDDDQGLHRRLCLDATFEIWSIVDQIVQKFYRKDDFDLRSAKSFLDTVQAWSASLSPTIRKHNSGGASILQNQEHAIGNLHVACSYYYAVMLATRKFLVSHISSRLADSTYADADDSKLDDSADNLDVSKLAKTCTESAMLTLQTCNEVSEAGMLLNNMCLLKAWIFGAALILGFAMFAQETPDPEMDEAFNGGNAVLYKLSHCSPQAKLYLDILSNLRNAIREHQQKRASRKRGHGRNSFVEKLFSLDDSRGEPNLQQTPPSSTGNFSETALDVPGLHQVDSTDQDNFATMDFGTDINMGFDGIDSVAVQLWDEFLLGQDMNSGMWQPQEVE